MFAVGDIAATDPNRCSARYLAFRVVTGNITALERGKGALRRFSPPRYRWGSILGLQDDGMTIYQANGNSVHVPRWAVQPVLFQRFTHVALYGDPRKPPASSRSR